MFGSNERNSSTISSSGRLSGKGGQNNIRRGSEFNLGISENIFELHNISLEFAGIKALDDITMQVKKGEILFVTGSSGAGKSTLLNLMSGNLNETGGLIKRDDHQFVSRVFQDLKLMKDKTVKENLMYAYDAQVYRNKKEFSSQLEEILSLLGLIRRKDSKLYELNGGAKQKVAIARSILSKPDVILLDEPTSALDSENAKRVFDLLNFLNEKRGLTVVWASHNSEVVKKYFGRIVHLDCGKLVYSGNACFI